MARPWCDTPTPYCDMREREREREMAMVGSRSYNNYTNNKKKPNDDKHYSKVQGCLESCTMCVELHAKML